MFSINEVHLDNLVRPLSMKQTDGDQVLDVFEAYKLMFWNMHDTTSKFKAYNMVQWVKYIDHWSRTHGQRYTTRYSRGDILMVDLGAMNFGFEFGYSHPVVVLYETTDMLFVIPGSSKKFGLGQRGIVDATSAHDGFNRDTGLLLYNMRWIHKNRVKQSTGRQTSPRVLKEIEEFNLRLNHEYHEDVQRRARSNQQLRRTVFDLNQQISQQQQTINEKDQEIEEIKRKALGNERRLENYKKHFEKIEEILESLKQQPLDPKLHDLIQTISFNQLEASGE